MAKPEFFDTPGYGEIARTRNYYRQALRVGDRIEISGQGGWDADFTLSATSLEEEIAKACDNIEKTLAEAGASWRDIVNIHSYHVPTADDSIGGAHMSAMVDQFRKRFGEKSAAVDRAGRRGARTGRPTRRDRGRRHRRIQQQVGLGTRTRNMARQWDPRHVLLR